MRHCRDDGEPRPIQPQRAGGAEATHARDDGRDHHLGGAAEPEPRRIEVFRRQHPIGPFVDFCCPDRSLAVELDGAVHATQAEHDAELESLLATAGYRVIRFPNDAVFDDLPAVIAAISEAAVSEPPRPRTFTRSGAW